MYNINDTIAAIATSAGEGGIGIVRISGKEALSVADRIFIPKNGVKLSRFKTYTVHYGFVIDASLSGSDDARECADTGMKIVDEALLTVMREPKSYTCQDVVEISCHGGMMVTRRVLELALENGCRMAERGEFTLRAFLNGRIDLAQAEAVADVISSKTSRALSLSVAQLKGALSKRLKLLRDELLNFVSEVEAQIDFPQEDIDVDGDERLRERISNIENEFSRMLDDAKTGKVLREGISVCIFGRPNVGKSSLLNALLKEERAIVTPVSGTTRDTIEEVMDIGGIPVRIIDTAGIIEPRDLVEKKAVDRSRRYFKEADIVLLVFDGSKPLNKADSALLKKIRRREFIVVINKSDLKEKLNIVLDKGIAAVHVSALKRKGIVELEQAIADKALGTDHPVQNEWLLSNARQINLVKKAKEALGRARRCLDDGLSQELIAVELRGALDLLGEVLGENLGDNILDNIFSRFCIGK